MGANVTSVEKDKTSFDLACLLNELLFCDSIKMANCDIRNIEVSKKYYFLLAFSLLHKYMNTKEGLEILNIIDNITDKIMFWESGDDPEEEKKWIFENSSFLNYKKLKNTFGENRFSELGIFYKG